MDNDLLLEFYKQMYRHQRLSTLTPIINSNQTNTGMSYLTEEEVYSLIKSKKVELPAKVTCQIRDVEIEDATLVDTGEYFLICQDKMSGNDIQDGIRLSGYKYNLFVGYSNDSNPHIRFSHDSNKPVGKFEFESMSKHKAAELDLTHFDRVVMHADAKEQIIAVLKQHKNYSKIFEEWGLGETIEYGKGMTFFFHGPPGTGKTWAANMIAKTLGKELMVLTAAEIQTAEPGGANRNIQQAFKAAGKKKVLLLDECDSLIAKRSNMGMIMGGEINTLLTEIENFEGVLVLTTNRIGAMDEALERRISLIIEFPQPNYEQRLDIWKKMIPKKLPLHKNVKINKLAEYKLTGGQIKNVLLGAARTAVAAELAEVKQEHFISSIEHLQNSSALMGTEDRTIQVKVDHEKTGGVLTKAPQDVTVNKA